MLAKKQRISLALAIGFGVLALTGTAVAKVLEASVETPFPAIAECGGGSGTFVTHVYDDGTSNSFTVCD